MANVRKSKETKKKHHIASKLKALVKHVNLWKRLRKAKRGEFAKAIKKLPPKKIESICECVFNAIHTSLSISKTRAAKLRQKISPHKKDYIRLADKKVPTAEKRTLLIQHGTGIGMILTTLLPIIASLIR